MRVCLGILTVIAGASLLFPSMSCAAEDNYPSKPVRLVVPWPAGSVSDSLSRFVAEHATSYLGVRIIVDNKPGAAGAIGTDYVARSKPDGYVFLHGTASQMAVVPATGAKLPYDPVNDFAPVTMIGRGELVLVVPASLKANTVSDLIALAKSQPSGLTYGTMGQGTLTHFASVLLAKAASIEATHVPYKGNNEVLLDLIGGRIQFAFDFLPTSSPHIAAGKLRPLMVTSPRRLSALANVPTAAEAGFSELEIFTWGGYFVPASTPAKVVERLNGALVRALDEPEVRRQLRSWGLEAEPTSPQAFGAFLAGERARWASRAKLTGIRAQE